MEKARITVTTRNGKPINVQNIESDSWIELDKQITAAHAELGARYPDHYIFINRSNHFHIMEPAKC